MKIKLKKNEKLSKWDSFSGFSTEDFNCLNSGGTVEVDSVPEIVKDLIEIIKSKKENK